MLAAVEGPAGGDPAGRDERAVEDDAGAPGPVRVAERGAQLRGTGGEQFHRLVHVSPGRGPADAESGRQLGERLALAQVSQDEQGLLPGVQLPPPRPDGLQVAADDPRRVVEGLAGQRQPGTAEKHGSPW